MERKIRILVKKLRKNRLLILILAIAAFFRFYSIFSFQYFSGDEEILYFLTDKIIKNKPILVVPNAQLSSSIGSIYHLLSSPLLFLADGDPKKMGIFGSLLGVFTTLMIYKLGCMLHSKKLGYIAGFLYASSFMISLFDRRWWALTPDPLFVVISMIGAIKLIQGRHIYLLALVIPASFAWHSDPSLAVLLVVIPLIFFFYKLPIFRKEYIMSVLFLIVSVLPIFLFELRHPGTVVKPFITHFTNRNAVNENLEYRETISLSFISNNFTRIFFTKPSENIGEYFHYEENYPSPYFHQISVFLVLLVVFLPTIFYFYKKNLDTAEINKKFFVPHLYLLSFLIGIALYSLSLSYSSHQHYYVVVFPVFVILAAETLLILSNRGYNTIIIPVMFLIFILNINTLLNSSLRYPTSDKFDFLSKLSERTSWDDSSLYVFGERGITDAGWVYILYNQGQVPKRSYLNWGWDWIYRSHGLFPYDPDIGDGRNIVVIHRDNEKAVSEEFSSRIIQTINHKNMTATILDNEDGWYKDDYLSKLQDTYY